MTKTTKPVQQKPDQDIALQFTDEQVNNFRKLLIEVFNTTTDTGMIKEFLRLEAVKNPTPEQQARKNKVFKELLAMSSLENGGWVSNIGLNSENIRGILKMRQDLAKEYDCKTPSEFMLVDNIVAGYWRSMRYERYIHSMIEQGDGGYSFDQLKVNVIKELHKGMNLAQSAITIHLTTLQNLKQPKLSIKVKTENAYIAQNQQVINTEPKQPKPVEGEVN